MYDDRDPLKRYEQFAEHQLLLNTYGKIRSVVINEQYLRGSPADMCAFLFLPVRGTDR